MFNSICVVTMNKLQIFICCLGIWVFRTQTNLCNLRWIVNLWQPNVFFFFTYQKKKKKTLGCHFFLLIGKKKKNNRLPLFLIPFSCICIPLNHSRCFLFFLSCVCSANCHSLPRQPRSARRSCQEKNLSKV